MSQENATSEVEVYKDNKCAADVADSLKKMKSAYSDFLPVKTEKLNDVK